jgi:acetyl esterase/lipase
MSTSLSAANPSVLTGSAEMLLWPQGAPGALGNAPADIPTITPYLPEPGKANGAALLVCPGGGYSDLAEHEGEGYARFFTESGVTAFVLTYRLGSAGYHYPAMFLDVSRAVRTIRAHAAEWGIDPRRIGIIGSSAGGHLASTLLTHNDAGQPDSAHPIERASSRPDFGILCYPVITLDAFHSHGGSKDNLLGPHPLPELLTYLSNELQVTASTPPCFLFHTWEDTVVNVENTLMFAAALRAQGVHFDLHVYEKGGHGIGLGGTWDKPETLHPWTRDCVYWLKARQIIS